MICNDCQGHALKFPFEVSGWNIKLQKEYPSLYRNTPTCPKCGLIGAMKKSKLQDALYIIKSQIEDPQVIMDFMAFYRKRQKDFIDGTSIARAFLKGH